MKRMKTKYFKNPDCLATAVLSTFMGLLGFSTGAIGFGVFFGIIAIVALVFVFGLFGIGTVSTLLMLSASVYSAPPLPPFPTVKRTPPLLSPKAASAPKSTPMVKATTFTPAGVGYDVPGLAPTLPPTFQTNLTIFQPDGSEVQRDLARVICKQRAGKGIRVEYTDGVPSSTGPWEFLADWAPYIEERIIVTERYTDPAYRPQARFFRVVEYGTAVRAALRTATPYTLNPKIKGVFTWRLPVPK